MCDTTGGSGATPGNHPKLLLKNSNEEEKLKGVRPQYEITATACTQLSALHRARSGSNHAHNNYPGLGHNDDKDHQVEESEDRWRRNNLQHRDFNKDDRREGYHHFYNKHVENHDPGTSRQARDDSRTSNGFDSCSSSEDSFHDRSGSKDRSSQDCSRSA